MLTYQTSVTTPHQHLYFSKGYGVPLWRIVFMEPKIGLLQARIPDTRADSISDTVAMGRKSIFDFPLVRASFDSMSWALRRWLA